MTTPSIMIALLILIVGCVQYALCVQAIRDLLHRPRVRGENKVLWTLLILCLPIAGAIIYNWMGPTSFIHRPLTNAGPPRPVITREAKPGATITPIDAARFARRRSGAPPASIPNNQRGRRSSFPGRTGS